MTPRVTRASRPSVRQDFPADDFSPVQGRFRRSRSQTCWVPRALPVLLRRALAARSCQSVACAKSRKPAAVPRACGYVPCPPTNHADRFPTIQYCKNRRRTALASQWHPARENCRKSLAGCHAPCPCSFGGLLRREVAKAWRVRKVESPRPFRAGADTFHASRRTTRRGFRCFNAARTGAEQHWQASGTPRAKDLALCSFPDRLPGTVDGDTLPLHNAVVAAAGV
jgi:hypothetical protein